MPANLPPEYFRAEEKFRQASSPREKVSALEELLATIPKHKGTDKLRADLRRKLSRLRDESAKKKKSGSKGDLYTVEKQGAAQVALVGFANSGKSSVLAAITNARPHIAAYPMTTVMPLSGMMFFEDIQFQIVDLPPVGNESTDGWVSGILRNADILMLVIDLSDNSEGWTELLLDQITEWKLPVFRQGADGKRLIIAANKSDLPAAEEGLKEVKQKYESLYPVAELSVAEKKGIEELRRVIFDNSGIIRVYSKKIGKPPDLKTPFTIPSGSNVLDLASEIHKEFVANLKYACIWGSSKFDGQRVQKDYVLHDRDIVEYHIK